MLGRSLGTGGAKRSGFGVRAEALPLDGPPEAMGLPSRLNWEFFWRTSGTRPGDCHMPFRSLAETSVIVSLSWRVDVLEVDARRSLDGSFWFVEASSDVPGLEMAPTMVVSLLASFSDCFSLFSSPDFS